MVGADRIAANGDTANKIGTYSVAVLAKENKIPFYVAAPLSTFDLSLENGDAIPIEERHSREVTHLAGFPVAPEGVRCAIPPSMSPRPATLPASSPRRGCCTGDYAVSIRDTGG